MSVQIDWQPIEGKRVSEAIYEQLRRQITSGRLKPGDRLPSERAMMQQLGRSRPTIREALRMLEQGGYVSSTHGASGAVVQELTLDGVEQPLTEMIQLNQISLEELGEYREVNDSTIAGWAAQRRTDEDIAALERLPPLCGAGRDVPQPAVPGHRQSGGCHRHRCAGQRGAADAAEEDADHFRCRPVGAGQPYSGAAQGDPVRHPAAGRRFGPPRHAGAYPRRRPGSEGMKNRK